MNKESKYSIQVLTDHSRLNEIFKLRVEAWDSSQGSNIINHNKYPEGLKDEFDDDSIHLVALDTFSDEIISASRITLFEHADNYPYIGLTHIEGFPKSNFSLVGRSVRSKNTEHKRLQYEFVTFGASILSARGIKIVTGHVYNQNTYMQNFMIDCGFKFLCNVDKENYNNPDIAFPGKLFIANL